MDENKLPSVLAQFKLKPEIKSIFQNAFITDDEESITILEEYKFFERDAIIRVLNKNTNGIPFVSLTEYDKNTEVINIEQKYQVLIKFDSGKAIVYVPGFREVNKDFIELELSKYDVEFMRITVPNYNRILDNEYKYKYDSMILFKRLLLEALERNATDLHFDVKHFSVEPSYTVACRVDAELQPIELFELDAALNKEIVAKLIESKTSTSSIDLDSPSGVTANSSNIFGTNDVELRISANKCVDGYHCVIRIQKRATFSFTLDKLGFHKKVQKDLELITTKTNGATLITGAIRTGKNTTAFALENEMIHKPIKVVSYEYPIEALMPVTQVDYKNDEKMLLNAIRLCKKQDVNVAFLNEIPNKEVAFAVQDIVNSSVHVITTMHLHRLYLIPYRLKEYYGESYKDIISQINGIFNQKMFGVCCPHCQEDMLVADLQDERKRDLLMNAGLKTVKRNAGCEICAHTGKVIGKNQPYAEHLLFDTALIEDLLKCEAPYQMEMVLKKELFKRNQNLEWYLIEGIKAGVLSIDALNSVL